MQRASDLLSGVSMSASNNIKIIDRARSAMNELWKIGLAENNPVWYQHKEHRYEILDNIEYLKQFSQVDTSLMELVKMVEVGDLQTLPSFDSCRIQDPMSTKGVFGQGLQTEASRDMALIKISPTKLVELLMDLNQWCTAFYNIVSRAEILGFFTDGVHGSYNEKMHVMSAEFHLPSPFIPTRECVFARYCKQFSHNIWAVVDVSLEDILPSLSNNFHKRPSGCLIVGMPDGNSKIIWVEHVVADHSQLDGLFKLFVTSGLAFGAPRWLASIVRHIEWSETLMDTKLIADARVLIPQIGRTSLLKLAERMRRRFCANLSSTTSNPWIRLAPVPADSTDIRVMIGDNNMAGIASVVFCTTLWLNVSPNRLFNFLRHEKSRSKWDKLSENLAIQEFACMLTGKHPENRVSLLSASTSKDKNEIFYLQESYADATASYVIYAPLDEPALTSLVTGSSNPDNVVAYPSGFAIIPGGLPKDGDKGRGNADSTANNESLLTISFHIIDNASNVASITPESVQTIYNIITETVAAIKAAVLYHSQLNNWDQDEVANNLAALVV